MSCSVSELVTQNRPGPGIKPGKSPAATSGAATCRLRGSSATTLATPTKSKGGGGGGGGNSESGGGAGASEGGGVPPPAITGSQQLSGPQNGPQPAGGGSGGGPAPLRPKPCCLCWCCCCSCSCSTPGKGNDENGPTRNSNKSDLFNCDGDPPPTLEEIRSWGRSFDKLMRSPGGRKVFRDFLRCEYSEENILFWLACEELKKENNPEVVEEKARIIYEDYISILSPKEVSLDSRVREIVNRNMVEPTPHTFDEAQLQIYTLMHRDSYPRFVNSQLYRTLAQQELQADKEERTSGTTDQDAPGSRG